MSGHPVAEGQTLYDSIGPNPRVVRMFAAEKGIGLAIVPVDVVAGENRRDPFLAINPGGTTPVLELADGTRLSETVAICEYFEELVPEPALIGRTPAERAATRMWARRIDLLIATPLTLGFRSIEGCGLFAPRMRVVCPEGGADLKAIAQDNLRWLDAQIGERPYVAGDAPTLADILLFCIVEFGAAVGQPLPADAARLALWHERMQARPSAAA